MRASPHAVRCEHDVAADVFGARAGFTSGQAAERPAQPVWDTVGAPMPYFSTRGGCVELQRGYYSQPPFAELLTMSEEQLKRVSNFQVGRKGFGEIVWHDAVDLTGAPRRFCPTSHTMPCTPLGRRLRRGRVLTLPMPCRRGPPPPPVTWLQDKIFAKISLLRKASSASIATRRRTRSPRSARS